MGAQVFRTDRHDDANTRLPQICEFAWQQYTTKFPASSSNKCAHPCNLECTYFLTLCCVILQRTQMLPPHCTHRNVRSRRSHTAAHRNTESYSAWFVNIKMSHYCRKSLNRPLRSVMYAFPGMARHVFQKNDVQLEMHAQQGPLLQVRWHTLTAQSHSVQIKPRPNSSAEAFRHPRRRQRRGQTNTWWSDPHSWFMTTQQNVFLSGFSIPLHQTTFRCATGHW